MNRCVHCDTIIEDPTRTKFCSDWCSKDYYQPEGKRSLRRQAYSIKDGVYEDEELIL